MFRALPLATVVESRLRRLPTDQVDHRLEWAWHLLLYMVSLTDLQHSQQHI